MLPTAPPLRALTFNDDGTVTLTSDYYNDEPVVIENRRVEMPTMGMVKVTLTGQESGQLFLLPTVITFTVDGDARPGPSTTMRRSTVPMV